MRCLGRLFTLLIILGLLGGGWLYRDTIQRHFGDLVDPMAAARRVGEPTAAAGEHARTKLSALVSAGSDSVILTPSEVGALVLDGLGWQTGGWADSLHVELGDRSFTVSGRVSTQMVTAPLRKVLKISLAPTEPVTLSGTLTPASASTAEWHIERATIHGVPLPSSLVGRVLSELGIPASDGRLQIPLPVGVSGFRVRPEGVAFYGGAKP